MVDRTPRISISEYHDSLKKPQKYKSKATRVDGRHFPSQLEGSMFSQLLFLQSLGEKTEVKQYFTVHLSKANVAWKIDAACRDVKTGQFEVHEAKGKENADYLIKLKLYKTYGKFPLYLWTGSARRPIMHPPIIPKGLE